MHAQSKWIRSLEGDLKTAEGRAERFQATGVAATKSQVSGMWQGLAAQKELETALSQLQVSSEARRDGLKGLGHQEAKNGRIAHLEGKLQALESREPKKVGPPLLWKRSLRQMKHSSSEGSVRSSRIADLERQAGLYTSGAHSLDRWRS